ncbi:DHA2 family efflux MFS transporter permease subunit [Streptomyces sp. NPDC005438]|uniref:DHA2 family efflux MFS transporter permease subunit n=1 Tax=Streptomyces sp. NPDC005438 TaxID=3156880 RepID=UPI00339F90D0
MATGSAPSPERGKVAPSPTAVALVVVTGALMTVLDTTIVHVALNHLAGVLHAPLATMQWVTTGYTLALASVIPLSAWAMDRVGAGRLYLLAIALFGAGSLLAGLAWNVESLILFRVLQGLGGGLVMPVGMAMVVRAADRRRMGRTMSLLGLPVLIGPLAGPTLGGWLVDHASWRGMFLVNLPVAVLTLALGWRILPRHRPPRTTTRLDLPGLLTLSPGLALLIYGLATAGEHHRLTDPAALTTTLAGLTLVTVFVLRSLRVEAPLIPLRLFAERTFTAGALTMVAFPLAYFGSMVLTPLYLMLVHGLTATQAGMLAIPQALTTGVTMQVASRMVDRVPAARLVLCGIALASSAMAGVALQLGPDTPLWRLVSTLALMGAGVGMTMMPTLTAVSRELSDERTPAGTATLNIVSQVASATGTALLSVTLAGAMSRRLPEGLGDLDALHRLSERAREALAPELAGAFQTAYGVAATVMALALLPAWALPRRRPDAPPDPVPDSGEPALERG